MPDDRLRELFGQATEAPVRVPPVSQVRAMGERRRSRARLQASTIAWTIALAAGFGAPQVSGSLAQGTPRYGQVPASRSAPVGSYPSAPAMGSASSPAPATASSAISGEPGDRSPSPHSTASTRHLAPALPPPGGGQLLLALDSAHRFVMTRLGSAAAPVRVASLTAVAGAPPVLATNPAGGWVVTLASLSRSGRVRGARLACVAASGHSVLFGPLFRQKAVTSAAVSDDGSRVAVALTIRSGGARIEVLPLPGHQAAKRTWDVPAAQASLVTGLSWSPDGRHLSYLAAQSTGQSADGAPVFLDTAASVAVVPDQTSAPMPTKPGVTGVTCVAKAAAWLGTTGRYAVLSECPSTGAVVLQTSASAAGDGAGKPVVVAHRTGCGAATLNSNAAGTMVLISYCGVYVVDRGRLSPGPVTLTAAAPSG